MNNVVYGVTVAGCLIIGSISFACGSGGDGGSDGGDGGSGGSAGASSEGSPDGDGWHDYTFVDGTWAERWEAFVRAKDATISRLYEAYVPTTTSLQGGYETADRS